MYFPKSQTQTGLYTNGNEYTVLGSNKPYVGPYWKVSTGRFFSGQSPQDPSSQQLVPWTPEASIIVAPEFGTDVDIRTQVSGDSEVYRQLKGLTFTDLLRQAPQGGDVPPTESDYSVGEYRRYFCKKANELIYLELDKVVFEKLTRRDPTIVWELYPAFDIPWLLVGEAQNVFNVNKRITDLVIKQKNLIGFAQFLKNDYLKYYRG
jgi:hypothetical protein